jgi:8-amino-7-oxononanoate synthase
MRENPFYQSIKEELTKLRQGNLLRQAASVDAWIDLSSNDYLGLSRNPAICSAACDAINQWGTGSRGSRLMSGTLDLHEKLEESLAGLLTTESALVFGSGFLSNMGTMSALLGPGDSCHADRLNHASLIDGMRLSGARFRRYRHNDLDDLSRLLKKSDRTGKTVIVSDSIFSMDGDRANVGELVDLARQYDAFLVIDEAHAIGVFGNCGGGLASDLPAERRPDMVLGTMSKSLGGYGGFVGCSRLMRDFLVNRARPFTYSTALPPASVASALAAVEIIKREKNLGEQLMDKVTLFHQRLIENGLDLPPIESPIIPVLIGDNEKSLTVANRLRADGLLVTAIRPPTVPAGTARLRLSVSLAHRDADLLSAADQIASVVLQELGR